MLRQICDGMAEVGKEGLVHRDLRPESVIVCRCVRAAVRGCRVHIPSDESCPDESLRFGAGAGVALLPLNPVRQLDTIRGLAVESPFFL